MRLQKRMALAGVASRRRSEEMIAAGRVKVNGLTVTEMGFLVGGSDAVELDGVGLAMPGPGRHIYIALNKPRGCISSVKDQFGRATVIDALTSGSGVNFRYDPGLHGRVFPVGRLDYGTTGLLVLTDDGDYAYRATHPGFGVEKEYLAMVRGVLGADAVRALESGIDIGGGATMPAKVSASPKGGLTAVRIAIREGRNRQVRLMLDAVGCQVVSLCRTRIGGLSLGGLHVGQYRLLRDGEQAKVFLG